MAAPAVEEGVNGALAEPVPRTELQELQLSMDTKTDESLESTRRMLSLCEESTATGAKTLNMLDQQGEQLDRIDEGMDQINQDMRDAEKNLEGLEKCCGLCVLPWKRSRSKNFEKGSDYANTWGKNEDGKVNTDGPRMIVGEQMGPTGGLITRITNDAREEEMENNVGEVNSMLGNLRNMAVDMGNEIDSQNRQVDRVNQKADGLGTRMDTAYHQANNILNPQNDWLSSQTLLGGVLNMPTVLLAVTPVGLPLDLNLGASSKNTSTSVPGTSGKTVKQNGK